MFKAVLFDLDGTLIDHMPAIHRCYAHTLPQLGLPEPTYDQVKRAVGGGLENAMRRFVDEPHLAEALRIYRAYWDRTMLDGASVMPGAVELLDALSARRVTLAVITNKLGESSRELCRHLGLAHYFREILGAKDTPWLKPQREISAHLLNKLDASAATTCLVGDSPWDVQTAHDGGFVCHVVTTGTHTAEELRAVGADGIHDNLTQLGVAVFGLNKE